MSSAKRSSKSSKSGESRKRSTSRGRRRSLSTGKRRSSTKTLDQLFVDAGAKHGVNGKLRVHGDPDKEREIVHIAVMDTFKVTPAQPGAVRPNNIDLGLLTTAPIETFGVLQALRNPLHHIVHVGSSSWHCYTGDFYGVPAVVAKSDQGPSGSHGSINATGLLCSEWGIKTLWAVGIALGADPSTQKHGDVLAATAVQVYETREQTGADGKKKVTLSHAPWPVSPAHKTVIESTCAKTKGAHSGLVVSAPKLLDDAGATSEQLGVVRKAVPSMPVIGGEMEMGGVISVCLGTGVSWGIVKGICDFGGLDKAKSKEWQPLATANAVSWMGSAVGGGSWIKALPTPALGALKVMPFDEYTEKKRHGFVGRKELFGKMAAFSGRVLLIKGEAGIGKSALMAEFAARNADIVIAKHFCQFGDASTLDRERWLRSIVGQVMRWARKHGVSLPDAAVEAVLDETTSVPGRFAAFSKALPASGPSNVWILVDSLDEAVQAGGARSGFDIVRAVGRAAFPPWVRLVASTRADPVVMTALEREIKDVVVMQSSSEENMRDVRAWLSTVGGVKDNKTLDAVLKASGGNFLYVRQLVVDGNIESRLKSMPAGLAGIYSARAKALWEDAEEFEGDVPVLSVLVAARAPVPVDLLKKAGKATAGGGRLNVKRIVEALASVLDTGKDGAVRVFHKSFVDWCTEVGYDGVKAVPRDGHKGLALSGLSLWEGGSVYAVRYTVAHGHASNVDVSAMAMNWNWMRRRAELDSWNAVASDVGGVEGAIVKLASADGEGVLASSLALHGGDKVRSSTSGLASAVKAWPLNRVPLPSGVWAVKQRWKAQRTMALSLWMEFLSMIVTCQGESNTMKLWTLIGTEWEEAGSLELGFDVTTMAALPETPLVVVRGSKCIAVVSLSERRVLKQIPVAYDEHRLPLCAVSDTLFASGTANPKQVSLWDVSADKPVWLFTGPSKATDVAALSDRRVLAVFKALLVVLDGNTGEKLAEHKLAWSLTQILPLPGSRALMLDLFDGIYMLSTDGVAKVNGPTDAKKMALLSDGETLAVMNQAGNLGLWRIADWTCHGVIEAKIPDPYSLICFADGGVASGMLDGSMVVWNTEAAVPSKTLDPREARKQRCWSAALLNDGRIVTGHENGTIRVSGEGGVVIDKAHEKSVSCLAALGDGGWVSAPETRRPMLRVWSADGKPKLEFNDHSKAIKAVAVLSDGVTVVSGDASGTVVWWSVKDGKERGRVAAGKTEVKSLCVVKDSVVAVGLYLEPVALVDVTSGTLVAKLDVYSRMALYVFPQAGGSKLAAKGRVYDLFSPASPGLDVENYESTDMTVAEVKPGVMLSFEWPERTLRLWSVSELRVTHAVLATVPTGEELVQVLWDGSRDVCHAVCQSGSVFSFKLNL